MTQQNTLKESINDIKWEIDYYSYLTATAQPLEFFRLMAIINDLKGAKCLLEKALQKI